MTTHIADEIIGGVENAFRKLDLGGIVQDAKDVVFLLKPASVRLFKHTDDGINAFNNGDWILAANSFAAAAKLSSLPGEQDFFHFLKDFSEDRIHNLPRRPIDSAKRKRAEQFGIIIPG